MRAITVRNLPEDVHRALRMQAAMHGRSTEAEVRDILERAVKPEKRVRMGDALAKMSRQLKLTDEDLEIFQRDKASAEPMRFE